MSESVLRELDEYGVLLVTFNRPAKKNAFNDAQWDAASAALREAREDQRVAVVVVTGAGGDFSAGVDLSSFVQAPQRSDGHQSAYHAFMATLVEFDKPLLAAAKGVGVGIGATLLLHCDVVYVGESVRLRMPFVALGLVPEAASSYMLEAVVGARQAAELFFTAEWIDARRAVDTGIATRAYADSELLPATLLKAREIAQYPVGSLQATKRTLLVARRAGVRAALAAEDEGMLRQVGTPENIEAFQAFMEKRKPDFRMLRS
ncbi:MAG: enoyl-CoA hydratase/isomerase family protein [Deltaproteobacteria bacterium]|nr:enoyl-CoA hydratase/isomerase family protein [Deltaproteobacteria bacterium]